MKNEGFKYKGFKLISLRLTDSKLFGDIEYNFVDKDDKQDKIYTTVIIGPNGTRKSLLFNLIIFIFKSIHDLKENRPIAYEENSRYSSGQYYIKYALNNNIYEFARYADTTTKDHKFGYSLKLNGENVQAKKFELPKNIVANSINITDKFPVLKEGEFPRYHYLGIRYNPQSASTRSYLRKITNYVARLASNKAFLNGLNSIATNFIGQGKEICISYKTSQHSKFFSGELDFKTLDGYFNKIERDYKKRGKTAPFKLNNYKSLRDKSKNQLKELIAYCNTLANDESLVRKSGQSNRTFKFRLSSSKDLERLKDENTLINQLYSIGLLYDIKIEFEDKTDTGYALEDSSSGEYNLITSFIGLMSTVTQDSLVLIDEPEISLHPNWQMRYISFLKQLYNHEVYKTAHIIIASHSHFIVSDLEGSSSKIIGLSKNEKISLVPLDEHLNTFGWSAEEVLYSVFNVRSSRNAFLEYDLTKLVTLVNRNSKDYSEIKRILEKVATLVLSDNDPLKILEEKAKKYLELNNA